MEESEDQCTERTSLLRPQTSSMDKEPIVNIEAQDANDIWSRSRWSWSRLRFYLVEPMVLILVFGYNLSATVWKNQIIYQTCTTIYEYNSTDCRSLSTKNTSEYIKAIETEIQPYTAVIFMTNSLIQSIVPALCGSFVGAWSDRFGRKPLLIASYLGYFVFYAMTCGISYVSQNFDVSPWLYLVPSIPLSLLGDGITYSVATFCYISDVSTAKERPYRMTFYEIAVYTGLMLGSFSSGFIFEAYGSATLIFLISALCIFCACLIVIFIIPESLNARVTTSADKDANAGTSSAASAPQPQPQSQPQPQEAAESGSRTLIDIGHIRALYQTCFKMRQHEARTVILLIAGCLLTCAFVVEGSTTVFYLFVREKFQWSVKDFTTYESISILVPIFGNILGIWMLRKIFKLQLLTVAIIGLLSHTCSSVMKGFATANWQLYVAVAQGAFKSIINPMLRTVLTNMVPANELGKIFSFISALQAFLPFLASPLYTLVYRATLISFPGFFNILSANLFLIAIGLILAILRKKQLYPLYYATILN